jgi:alpha-tubulin suppressor-like RCC1 family protein
VSIESSFWGSIALKNDGSVINLDSTLSVPDSVKSSVTAISAGVADFMALKSDGSVVAWGNNADGSAVLQYVDPEALSGVVAIEDGYYYSMALKNDGKIISWGAITTASVPASAQTGVLINNSSNFLLSPNDVLTGFSIISGGPNIYISGIWPTPEHTQFQATPSHLPHRLL